MSQLYWTLLVLLMAVMTPGEHVQGAEAEEDTYEESLKLRSLPSNHIEAHFEFLTRTPKLSNFTRLFPRALAEILTTHNVKELHFSLTQGHWRLESWGDPRLAAPTGALVTAWFKAQNKEDADANWKGLTSRLSGLTCASLNFLDEKTSFEPYYSYRSEGNLQKQKSDPNLFVRVGALPKEHICTENLTPWTKLLPCGLTRGLASLLRSKQVFNTHYHSMGIHVTPKDSGLELKLSLSLVYDRPVDMKLKPHDNVAKKIIGSLGYFPCHPARKTTTEIWNNGVWVETDYNQINSLILSDIPEGKPSDLQLIFTPVKYMGGYGQEYGEIIVEMTNHLADASLPVLYVDVLPWYIRPYLHTMKLELKSALADSNTTSVVPGDLFHYTPGRDREVLHKLEMDLTLPPKSTVILSFLVEKGHLKWDEYPPDANHGFYLQAAHFEVTHSDSKNTPKTLFYYSRKLLVNLSTPDFSMPYNVICLTCTVVALAFGPIHNITTKTLGLKPIVSKMDNLKAFVYKLLRRKPAEVEAKVETENEADIKLLETISDTDETEIADQNDTTT